VTKLNPQQQPLADEGLLQRSEFREVWISNEDTKRCPKLWSWPFMSVSLKDILFSKFVTIKFDQSCFVWLEAAYIYRGDSSCFFCFIEGREVLLFDSLTRSRSLLRSQICCEVRFAFVKVVLKVNIFTYFWFLAIWLYVYCYYLFYILLLLFCRRCLI
jgi:hypothetical protein